MHHESIRHKILKHLEDMNEIERKQNADAIIETIAQQYDIPREIVEKSIAEWSAGAKINYKKDRED